MDNSIYREVFYNHNGRLIHKWDHYFEIYEKYLCKYKGKKVNILEIGISHGGSLELYKKYLGDQAMIYAIDINPECQQFEDSNTKIFIGSQSDQDFLNKVISQLPPLDVVIDDGGHTMIQQKVSF
jgi:23S rRNA U2552 (ribose-2'-O)-methylase RlmE/FtsJ